jgi:hypothetical protein
MQATEIHEPAEGVDAPVDGDPESLPWYAPGLYRRVQERRRARVERPARVSLWQRLRGRGLRWSVEVVVGMFVAVLVAALAALALSGAHSHAATTPDGDGATPAPATARPQATPACLAAPIPGAPQRPCTH